MENEVKVVAFDVDGTLYGKVPYGIRMFLSAFPNPLLALWYHDARNAYRKEQGKRETVPPDRNGYLLRLASLMVRASGRKPTERRITVMAERTERQIYGCWDHVYRRVPGRVGLVEAFRFLKEKGYRIAVLSDFPLGPKLEALHVRTYVDIALSSEDVGYLKPDPRVFSAFLERIGAKPEEVLYVGDSYRKDVLGALGAGMHSCLLSKRRPQVYPRAESVVKSFKELVNLFR